MSAHDVYVIMCGGREFGDYEQVLETLDTLRCSLEPEQRLVVLQGEARGADTLAKRACAQRSVECISYDAEWERFGNRAGFMRNTLMAERLAFERQQGARVKCYAFEGGNGTAHMVREARRLKISVREIQPVPRVWNRNTGDAPKGAVYIGRPSYWGNPFPVGQYGRERCIEMYRERLEASPEMLELVRELRGKHLVCYCAPLACHGDVLLALANPQLIHTHNMKETQ